jgi:hypothetical protein
MDRLRRKNRQARRAIGGPQPFTTDAEVLAFAKKFLKGRAWDFKKNLDICLTARANNYRKQDHAYMPGLLITIAFIEMLARLYAGDVSNPGGGPHFLAYMRKFMPAGRYSDDTLRLLYVGFRHKIAHLNHPYFVLDTKREQAWLALPPMRVVWRIYAAPRHPPIELLPEAGVIDTQPTPGLSGIAFDHRVHISIATLARDARNSLRGQAGYMAALADPVVLRNFKRCMTRFYST